MNSVKQDELLKLTIREYQIEDQEQVKGLILNGLMEHWDEIDPSLNADLDDIHTSYKDATFLVACVGRTIVGTGALIPHSVEVAEVVRMSVMQEFRRNGIGGKILQSLCEEAKKAGKQRIILETTSTWQEVIKFYTGCGFQPMYKRRNKWGYDTYFVKNL